MVKRLLKGALEGLDEPFSTTDDYKWYKFWKIKKNKLRVILVNEDGTFQEFFKKKPDSYTVDIKKKSYVVVPKAIIQGVFPTMIYFYNNPFPVWLEFQKSNIAALDLRSPDQLAKLKEEDKVTLANIGLDAESINLAFNTRVMRGLYSGGGITPKAIIIILVVIAVLLIIFLHIFGVIDVYAFLGVKR